MPWHVAKSASCPAGKPWAVIKDSDNSVAGCHATEDDANDQLRALYANDSENSIKRVLRYIAEVYGNE